MPTIVVAAFLLRQATVSAPRPFPDPLAAGWKGKPVCERLAEDDTQRVLRCTFPPGGGHDLHAHAPHFGYALSGGRMRITDATGVREAVLATGSTFTSTGVHWHEVLNIGETTVQYLIIESKAACPCATGPAATPKP